MEQPAQSAAEAFDSLKQEVALLRMAVQQMMNARQAPDYNQTLGKIMRDMKEASDGMTWLVNRPAIQVPAEELASRISAAGKQAREQDREMIREATRSLAQATAKIDYQNARSRVASEQKRWVWRAGMSGVAGGAIIGSVIAIGLVHMFPEQSAAWILRTRAVESRAAVDGGREVRGSVGNRVRCVANRKRPSNCLDLHHSGEAHR